MANPEALKKVVIPAENKSNEEPVETINRSHAIEIFPIEDIYKIFQQC